MNDDVFIPVEGQYFSSFSDWVNSATSRLTAHRDYNNTEHGDAGWRGRHFTALCFDQKGRRCTQGEHFMLARDDDSFPVWYVWPDQIPKIMESILYESS